MSVLIVHEMYYVSNVNQGAALVLNFFPFIAMNDGSDRDRVGSSVFIQ